MPDLKDELDALFGDEEKPQEEETEAKAEETAEDEKAMAAAAKKAKLAAVGARTGAIAARKVPGKAAVPPRTKAPEPEPEAEPAHAPANRVAPAHAHGSGGGNGLVKILLVVSLILNILVLVFAFSLLGQMGKLQDQMQTINKNITASTTMSRAEVGVYTDRGGVDTAILFYLPTDVNKFPQEGKAYRVPLDKLIQNTSKE